MTSGWIRIIALPAALLFCCATTSRAAGRAQEARQKRADALRTAAVWLGGWGLATALAGGYLYILAADVNTKIAAPLSGVFDPTLEDKRDRYQAWATLLFSVSGAAVAAGITCLILSRWPSRPVSISPAAGRGEAGVVLRVQF